MKKIFTLFFIILIGGMITPDLFGQPSSVSLTVGGTPIGTYSTIAAAYAAFTDATGGALIELTSAYDGSAETIPITLGPKTGTNASNRITIRPASGQTVLSFVDASLANRFFIIQGSYITIDGRAGGVGSSKNWTIQTRNVGASSSNIYLNGDAQFNIIQYCILQSPIGSQTAGLVRFGAGTTVGVSNNQVLFCDFSDYYDGVTRTYPRTLLYSLGGSASLLNSNNEIGNCNFYNWANASSSFAIYFTNFNSNWNIHDNSFYMTQTTGLSSNNSWGAISINGSTDGITFVNNYIGGSAPQCAGSMSLGGDVKLEPIKFLVVGVTNKNTITGNTIKNITFTRANASSSTNTMINLATGDYNDVTGNDIENITGTFSLATHTLRVFDVSTTTPASLNILQNKIVDPNISAAGTIDGIYVGGGNVTIANNMISIGASTSVDATIRGINISNTTNTANVYFNTVNISGTASGTSNTIALSRSILGATGADIIKNNILYNTRSGGTGKHAGIVSAASSLTSDYNDIYSGTSTTVGSVDNSTFTDFPTWKTNSSGDAHSKSVTAVFASAATGDLHLAGASIGNGNFTGTPGTGITIDFDGETRNASFPYMGADEITSSPLPVELSSFTSVVNGRVVSLKWETKTEFNFNKFEVERVLASSTDASLTWVNVGTVQASGTSNSPRNYSYIEKNLKIGKYQYRLKMIDNDGTFKYSNITEVDIALPTNFDLSQNFPNPFNPSTKISYQVPVDSRVILEVYNIAGQKVAEVVNQDQTAGYYSVDFGSSVKLSSGVYIYRMIASDKVTGNNFSSIKKMVLLK